MPGAGEEGSGQPAGAGAAQQQQAADTLTTPTPNPLLDESPQSDSIIPPAAASSTAAALLPPIPTSSASSIVPSPSQDQQVKFACSFPVFYSPTTTITLLYIAAFTLPACY